MQIKNNILNKYEDDAQMHSSGTFLIELQVGQVTILNSIFSQNAVYNSTDSILFIKTSSLILENCTFQDSNIFNAEVISKNILLYKIQHYDLNYTLQTIFSIQSQGGSGYFVVNAVEIRNTLVNNTWAVNGGAFYIITGSNGQVLIRDSYFSKSQTILAANSFSSGGAVYIDSTKSQLKLEIQNTMFLETYSRTFGGVIYIDASKTKNAILINNSTFISCFSFQHSVLSFSPSQIQQQKSEILISNCYFRNPQINYELYVSQIQDFTDINIETFQFFNPLIYSQNCYLIVYNCTFQEIHIANILQIEKGINVKLEAIRILNCTISYNSLISITNRENFNSVLIFKDFVIMNVREFFVEQNYECQVQPQDIIHEILCPNQINDIIQKPLITNIQINQSPNYCSLKKLYNRQEQKFSLIVIKGLSNDQIFEVENFLIQNNICNTCYYGLINFATFSYLDNNLIIKYLQVQNNICGFLGCISIFQEYDDIFLQNQNLRLLTEKIFMEYNTKFQIQVKLIKSSFINNTASYGAACFFAKLNIFIQDCFFHLNFAQEKGGAIYFYSEGNEFLAINSEIIENQAQIAGGLYINQSQVQQLNQFNFLILDNEAKSYADNLLTQPSKLKIRVNGIELEQRTEFQNLSTLIDIVRIKPYQILGNQELTQNLLFPSGIKISSYKYFDSFSSVYIPYNFSFRLIALNQKNEQIIDLKQSSCQIFTTIIYDGNFSISQFQQTQGTLSQYQINFNSQTGDYNLDDLIIYFNPKLENTTELQLAFQCNQIRIPQYNPNYPYELQNIIDNYILVLKLKTFECQLGEYLNVTSGGCVQCDVQQNQYSITKDAIQCEYKDELKMKNITSAMIELREGFWRAFYDSRIVEECYHLKLNCLGGWIAGDPSCNIGHIGALCEQCDIYNIKGLGSYSQSQNYSCSNCTEMAKNIITIILAFIWTLLSIFLSVNSTIKMIDEFIIYTKLRTFGKFLIFQVDSISILIKVFTNYLQIISSLSTFQLAIPIGITLSFQSIGNPIESMSFSLDCYFVQFTELEIIYTRILWAFVQVGIFISIFLIIHIILLIINNQKMSLTFVTTTLIYIYIYLSPNLLSGLISLMSYRTISNEKWITSNVSYLYNTDQHLKWLLYLILPVFLLISIILPFFFFGILYYHRAKLNQTKIRQIWGYLYNEYKDETYFWEIIKIIQKELIILVLIYYVDYVSIKSSLIFFILHLYGILTNKYKPYQNGDLNQIDSFQTSVCKASIILAQTIYSAQNLDLVEITGPFYVILTIMNLFFVIKIITKLFFAYFDKLHLQIDSLKTLILIRCPSFFTKQRQCQKLLINSSERKQIIRQRFLLIKAYLLLQARQIISYKKLNNLDFNSLRTNKDISRIYQQSIINQNKAIRLNTNLNTSRTSKILTSIQQQEI